MILSSTYFFDNYDISRKISHTTQKLCNKNVQSYPRQYVQIFILPKSKQEIRKDRDKAKYQYFGQSKETIPQTDPDPPRPKK